MLLHNQVLFLAVNTHLAVYKLADVSKYIFLTIISWLQFHQTLQWRHNERDGVWNQRRLDCLLNRLFRWIAKKISKLRVTVLCEGNPLDSPHQIPVTQKLFLFDDEEGPPQMIIYAKKDEFLGPSLHWWPMDSRKSQYCGKLC